MIETESIQAVVPEVVEALEAVVEVASSFDYTQIEDEANREQLCGAASRIKSSNQSIRTEMIQVGKELLAVKELLGQGQWGTWLRSELGMSPRTAQRYMSVVRVFPEIKTESLSHVTAEAMYLLAAKNTPEEVREQVMERVEQGEKLDRKAVLELIEKVEPREQIRSTKRSYKAFYNVLRGEQVESLVEDLKGRPDDERVELVENLKRLLAAVEG